MFKKVSFIVLLVVSLSCVLGKMPKYVLDSDYTFLEDAHLPCFIDREHQFDHTNILRVQDWSYNPEQFDYSTDLESNIWLRFTLTRKDFDQKQYFLHLYNGLIPKMKVYRRIEDRLQLIDSLGSLDPLQSRSYYYRDALVSLPYEEGNEEYFVQVYAKYYHGFDMAIRSTSNIYNYSLREYFNLGIFYGVLALILLYNLFLFFQLQEKLYLFYAFYVLMAIISSASTDLTGYWNFWSNYPWFNKFFVDQSKWMLTSSFVLYGLYFLKLEGIRSMYFKLALITSTIYILYNFLVINLYVSTIVWLFITILGIHLIVFWFVAYKTWRLGSNTAGLFLIGLTMIVLAFIGYYLRYWELIPVNVPTSFMLHYGIFAEVLVFSYAMSYRTRLEKQNKIEALHAKSKSDEKLIEQLEVNAELKEQVNQELEKRVAQRTVELQRANEELNEQKEEIFAMNEELARMTRQLHKEKKEQQTARIWQKNLSFDEFKEIFPSKIECYHFIKSLKEERGYECVKCKSTSFSEGTGFLAKRCTKCGYNESITAQTIFKGIKTPVENNFYMLYLIVEANFKITAKELSEQTGLSTKSTGNFKKMLNERFAEDHSKNWVEWILV